MEPMNNFTPRAQQVLALARKRSLRKFTLQERQLYLHEVLIQSVKEEKK